MVISSILSWVFDTNTSPNFALRKSNCTPQILLQMELKGTSMSSDNFQPRKAKRAEMKMSVCLLPAPSARLNKTLKHATSDSESHSLWPI